MLVEIGHRRNKPTGRHGVPVFFGSMDILVHFAAVVGRPELPAVIDPVAERKIRHPPVVDPAVVRDHIHDPFQPHSIGFSHHLFKRFIAAVTWVDPVIISDRIAVIGDLLQVIFKQGHTP
ncbi:hypothetical protein FQZ97_1006740 [compost metagenome]